MRESISLIITILIIVFLCRACNSDKGLVKYSIDTVHEYYHYADSVFNGKQLWKAQLNGELENHLKLEGT